MFHILSAKLPKHVFVVVFLLPDDAVERRKLGVNKERTTVALKGFI